MELTDLWICIIAAMWTAYFFLEGFDFGVVMLLPVLAKDDADRRVMLQTIGPFWDGNEVWLVVAGASTFAAFPNWYATLFSGFYLALFVIVVALIMRALGLEYRSKVDDPRWRSRWDLAVVIGSWVPAVLWGVAFANIARGVPINAKGDMTGGLLTLLNPFGLLGGVVSALLFMAHGCHFLALRTTGALRDRAVSLASRLSPAAIAAAGVFLIWNQVARGTVWVWTLVVVCLGALGVATAATRRGSDGLAFAATGLAIAAWILSIFANLYPEVMPSTTNPAYSLTVENAASGAYTLRVMSWIALLGAPVVVGYQAWSYWVFRQRVRRPDDSGHASAA